MAKGDGMQEGEMMVEGGVKTIEECLKEKLTVTVREVAQKEGVTIEEAKSLLGAYVKQHSPQDTGNFQVLYCVAGQRKSDHPDSRMEDPESDSGQFHIQLVTQQDLESVLDKYLPTASQYVHSIKSVSSQKSVVSSFELEKFPSLGYLCYPNIRTKCNTKPKNLTPVATKTEPPKPKITLNKSSAKIEVKPTSLEIKSDTVQPNLSTTSTDTKLPETKKKSISNFFNLAPRPTQKTSPVVIKQENSPTSMEESTNKFNKKPVSPLTETEVIIKTENAPETLNVERPVRRKQPKRRVVVFSEEEEEEEEEIQVVDSTPDVTMEEDTKPEIEAQKLADDLFSDQDSDDFAPPDPKLAASLPDTTTPIRPPSPPPVVTSEGPTLTPAPQLKTKKKLQFTVKASKSTPTSQPPAPRPDPVTPLSPALKKMKLDRPATPDSQSTAKQSSLSSFFRPKPKN